jgi:signal transduction histidine kinase/tetratricopeptide (TPR) repeat protein
MEKVVLSILLCPKDYKSNYYKDIRMTKLLKLIFFVFVFLSLFAKLHAENISLPTEENLLNKLKDSKDNPEKVNILSKLTIFYSDRNPELGISYAKKGIDLAAKLNYKVGLADCYSNLSNCYYVISDYTKAKEYANLALGIYNTLDKKKPIAVVYNVLGSICFAQSDFNEALSYFLKALKIDEELNIKYDIASDLGNIGNVYLFQSDFKKAEDYFLRSLKISNKINDLSLISSTYGNLGNIYFELSDYDKSLDYFNKSLEIAIKIESKISIANTYGNIGMIYLKTENFKKAKEFLDLSLKSQSALNNPIGMMINYGNLGGLYLKIAQNPKELIENKDLAQKLITKNDFLANSIDYSNKAIKIALEMNSSKELIEWYDNISSAYKLSNQWEKAFNYLEKSTKLKDSIFSQENKNKLAKIEASKENEVLQKQNENQKLQLTLFVITLILVIIIVIILLILFRKIRKDNQLLNEKNKQIEDANIELETQNIFIAETTIELEQLNDDLLSRERQLQELNATKDKFFSIIAHDIKNPLSALIVGSDLLFTYYNRFEDNERLKHIIKLSESSRFLLKLLENLLQWSRSQTDSIEFSPNENSINSLINENLELLKLNLSEKNIKIEYNPQTDHSSRFDYNMVNTVIRNLLTNAIKFTPNGGNIKINFDKTDENYHIISIKDSGIGIKKENLEKLFKIDKTISTPGTNNEKGTGLGLLLCKEFIEKHNGKIWVESEEGKGSTFYFTLP